MSFSIVPTSELTMSFVPTSELTMSFVPTRELTMSFVVGYYINTCEQLHLPEIEAGLDFLQSHHGARSISATTRSHQL